MKNKVELLAPAGNMEGFLGAIHAGADAVYLGGKSFGARAYADNFTQDEIIRCIQYAHFWNRKVYLTVNTLTKADEFSALYVYIKELYENGLDGVIIQDMGVFLFLKAHFPHLILHVSTQMTITGTYGAKYLKELGASRIVPARELSLTEIKEMKQDADIEIECFIHGAMCYCYSGQCLFSSILGGRSGNRGRCAQPCRLPYSVIDANGKNVTNAEIYPLSLKDMCTIESIGDLIEAGIDSFKIEGRMKKPEYTAGVTAVYRKYIDQYYAGRFHGIDKKDLQKLNTLYIRSERESGYYFRKNGPDMVTLQNPSYNGTDDSYLSMIRNQYILNAPKEAVQAVAVLEVGSPASLTFIGNQVTVSVEGDIVEEAQKQAISKENVLYQIGKLKDTVFDITSYEIYLGENCFYSLRQLNELRRKAVVAYTEAVISQNGFVLYDDSIPYEEDLTDQTKAKENVLKQLQQLSVLISNAAQLKAFTDCLDLSETNGIIKRLYLEWELVLQNEPLEKPFPELEIIVALPYIYRNDFQNKMDKLLSLEKHTDGFLVRNMEELSYLLIHEYHGKIYTDACLYHWNRYALKAFSNVTNGFCLPYELRAKEQHDLLREKKRFTSHNQSEKVIYGYLPMMLTANCVAKTTGNCRHNKHSKEIFLLEDRFHKKFPVSLQCTNCMNIIYNSVPLSLHNDVYKWEDCDLLRLQFTIEDYQLSKDIISFYLRRDNPTAFPVREYTTGHEKRGVE